jgi:hypothetical protein
MASLQPRHREDSPARKPETIALVDQALAEANSHQSAAVQALVKLGS